MPARSRIQTLPAVVKAWLDQALIRRGFGGYEQLTGELNGLLAEKGYGITVSKSGLGRYGKAVAQQQQRLKASIEAAKALNAVAGDDADALGQALVSTMQERLFDVLLDMEIDAEKLDVTKLTRAIADISRSSVGQKKWAAELRAKARAEALEEAATAVEKAAVQRGLGEDDASYWREQVLGVR